MTRHRIYLIGICGTAMGALAGLLKDSGHEVVGSDQGVYPPISEFLAAKRIPVLDGFEADHIDRTRPDLVIIGNVVRRENPEAVRVFELGLDYLSLPAALGRFFLEGRQSVVAAGTHGKTTTSALLAWLLESAGADPSFMIGGILNNFSANYKLGRGDHFVVEGDEYDTAFFDKEAKFLHYRPRWVVLTGVEFDHADIFDDLAAIKAMFAKFIALIPPDGRLMVFAHDAAAMELAAGAACPVIPYGFDDRAAIRAEAVSLGPGRVAFDLVIRGRSLGRFLSPLPGRHNLANALASLGLLLEMGFEPAALAHGLGSFAGVRRRQEVYARIPAGPGDILLMDDFAHHPSAVRETLAGLRPFFADRRLIAVFEPRTNTSRRKIFQADYPPSFDQADLVLVRKPPPKADIPEEEMFSSQRLVEDLKARGREAAFFPDTDSLLERLVEIARPGDLIAIMSNGGFDGLHGRLEAALAERWGRD